MPIMFEYARHQDQQHYIKEKKNENEKKRRDRKTVKSWEVTESVSAGVSTWIECSLHYKGKKKKKEKEIHL